MPTTPTSDPNDDHPGRDQAGLAARRPAPWPWGSTTTSTWRPARTMRSGVKRIAEAQGMAVVNGRQGRQRSGGPRRRRPFGRSQRRGRREGGQPQHRFAAHNGSSHARSRATEIDLVTQGWTISMSATRSRRILGRTWRRGCLAQAAGAPPALRPQRRCKGVRVRAATANTIVRLRGPDGRHGRTAAIRFRPAKSWKCRSRDPSKIHVICRPGRQLAADRHHRG